MRLAKGIKFNIIIAILLCIAFVLNAGYTLAAAAYSLNVSSIGDSQTETYTEFASMQGEGTGYSETYTYAVGSVNNSIKLNYGFSHKYDIAVKFEATYKDGEHLAKDFSLDMVDRDKWCVDMPMVSDLDRRGSYYALASTSNRLEGVMYYMGTLEGTGYLPIISGVTFYTSGNNTYVNEADELTITVTPIYSKSTGTYDSTHKFYTTSKFYNSDKTAINNWVTYMTAYQQDKTRVDETKCMYYNAYSTEETALEYPSDDLSWDGENLVMPTELERSNTAYKYKVIRTQTGEDAEGNAIYSYATSYDNVIAGNKYYGGLGVYVIPGSSLVTVDISFNYDWYDCASNQIITGDVNPIGYKFSNEMTKVGTAYYYNRTISEPTYIDVLEYMVLTASSGFKTALKNGYKVVIYNLTAKTHTSTPTGWTSSGESTINYEINNSSIQSGILIKKDKWASGSTHVETDVSIRNVGSTDLAISKFTVKGTLWYSEYGDQTSFSEQSTGTYLQEIRATDNTLLYRGVVVDENMWTSSYNPTTHVYTFTRNSGVNHIPSGSAITLISGVSVAQQSYPTEYTKIDGVDTGFIHDYWCTLEITVTTAKIDKDDITPYVAQSTYTDLEVETNGYYSQITSSSPAYIYVRNNTNQNISSVTIQSMTLHPLTSTNKPLRDQINTGSNVGYTVTNYVNGGSSTTATINLRPNEKVLLFAITPNSDAIIYSYKLSANVSGGKVDNTAQLTVNNEAGDANLINTSDKLYEFRLKSTTSFSGKLVNSGDFVCNTTASSGMYYAYYKGVILPEQLIRVFTGVASTINLQIDVIEHTQGWNAGRYIAGNYSAWSDDTSGALANWLTSMQTIYGEPPSKPV